MQEYSLDNIGHIEIEDEENPSTHRVAVQPEPAPRAVTARPVPSLDPSAPGKVLTLPDPVLPKTAAEIEARPVIRVEQFPDDLKASFALLEKINNLPEDTDAQRYVKNKHLEAIKQHCFRIQQGLPTVSRALPPHVTQPVRPGLVEEIRRKLLAKLNR
jgi:hypothetical protein